MSVVCSVHSRTSIPVIKRLNYFYNSWEIALPWVPYPTFHALKVPDPLPKTSRSPYDPVNRRTIKDTVEGLQDFSVKASIVLIGQDPMPYKLLKVIFKSPGLYAKHCV